MERTPDGSVERLSGGKEKKDKWRSKDKTRAHYNEKRRSHCLEMREWYLCVKSESTLAMNTKGANARLGDTCEMMKRAHYSGRNNHKWRSDYSKTKREAQHSSEKE